MRHVSSACPECHTAIARLGAAIAKGALKDFINLHEDEPFAAELISRQYVRKLAEEGASNVYGNRVRQVLRDLARGARRGTTESHDK